MSNRQFLSSQLLSFPDAAASHTVRFAGKLLDHYGAMLMRIALEQDEDGEDDISCGFISSDSTGLDEVPRACEASSELPVHAALVLRNLRDAWPAGARPSQVAVITDGSGLAFCPDYPGAQGEEWLSAIATERKAYLVLVPFRDHSPWALLTDSRPRTRH